MSYRLSGPQCECGRPLTQTGAVFCITCERQARAVGRRLDEARAALPLDRVLLLSTDHDFGVELNAWRAA